MKLSEMIRRTQEGAPVSMRHERWLIANEDSRYSPEAVAFATAVLSGTLGSSRGRKAGFRASMTGKCAKRQILRRLRVPEKRKTPDGKLANIFHTGNFMHLKWQMAGLTAGWLKDAEVPLDNHEIGLTGTADGIIDDGSLFEFKSINSRGFSSVSQRGARRDHLLQVHAYMIAGSIDAASIVYEDKDTGQWREERVAKTEEFTDKVLTEQEALQVAWKSKEMPPMLPECVQRDGREWSSCPFAYICHEKVVIEE